MYVVEGSLRRFEHMMLIVRYSISCIEVAHVLSFLQKVICRELGACPTLTVLLRRTIRDHLRRSRPGKIIYVFQRIHLRFFRACGLAFGRISFASSRRQCRTGS